MRMVEKKATTTKQQKSTLPTRKTINTMVCWTHGATKHFVTINIKRTFPPRALPWMVKQMKMPLKRRPPLLPLPAVNPLSTGMYRLRCKWCAALKQPPSKRKLCLQAQNTPEEQNQRWSCPILVNVPFWA
jgi:hypothetical protein